MKKLLLLGSIVSPCPPAKQGGTERVAYYQAKHLAKRGVQIIFVGAVGTENNFADELKKERVREGNNILESIEFVEIGGGTGIGTQEDALKFDPSQIEGSRRMRLEMAHMARVIALMHERGREYDFILNNLRGEAVLLPQAGSLGKTVVNVMHLNLFPQLAKLFEEYNTHIITISNAQRLNYPDVNYLSTIFNPVNTNTYVFDQNPKDYALMMGTIGRHKNQADAIKACKMVGVRLIIAGKVRDRDYFETEIKPCIDGKSVIYHGELEFGKKLRLYQKAKVFIFPISWQEPFGLVCIEALSCGTPVVAYPHGGPAEIVKDGVNGFLVDGVQELAERLKEIDMIDRKACRKDAIERFSDEVVGEQYFKTLESLFQNQQ